MFRCIIYSLLLQSNQSLYEFVQMEKFDKHVLHYNNISILSPVVRDSKTHNILFVQERKST